MYESNRKSILVLRPLGFATASRCNCAADANACLNELAFLPLVLQGRHQLRFFLFVDRCCVGCVFQRSDLQFFERATSRDLTAHVETNENMEVSLFILYMYMCI